jgi:hypothetical protein
MKGFLKLRQIKYYLITNLWFSIKLSDSNLTINSEINCLMVYLVSFAFKLKCCTPEPISIMLALTLETVSVN